MSKSAKTSLDLNICSLERFLIADSILTQVYNSIISHYHSETSPLETTQAVLDRKLHFERAHSKFLQYRESIEEFISFEFDEARMAPFHTNAYILEATINQIKLYQTLEAEVIY